MKLIRIQATNKTIFQELNKILDSKTFEFPKDSLQIPPPSYLSFFTNLWILLNQRTTYATNAAQPPQAVQDALSLTRLGMLLAQGRQGSFTYASTLGTISAGLDHIENLLSLKWLTPLQQKHFLHTLDNINLEKTLSRTGKADLISFLNLIATIDFTHLPKEYTRTFDDVAEFMIKRALLFNMPYHQSKRDIALMNNYFFSSTGFKRKLLTITPGYLSLSESTAKIMKRLHKLRIRLGLELYHAANGNYPDTLKLITTSPLIKIPINPMTEKPFKYKLLSNEYYELRDE